MHNHQTLWVNRWSGICQGRFETDVPVGFFADMLNYYITPSGAIAPRPGFESLTRTPDTLPPITIYPMDWNGELVIFVATKTHVYRLSFTSTGVPVWLLLYTWVTAATRCTFAPINTNTSPHIVFGNGSDKMQKFDGTTTTALPNDAPKGLPVAYKNYIAVFGIDGSPGRLQFNINNGDADTWLYGGIPRTLELQGTITSVYPYTGLLIFTDRRTEMFHGDPDQLEGQSVLSETIGCVEHKTLVEAEGTLIWLSYAGISYWDGSGVFPTGILSDPEGERISNITEDMRRVAWKNRKQFSFAYDPTSRRLFAAVQLLKSDYSGSVFRTYLYDFNYHAWLPWDLEAQAIAVSLSPTSSQARTLSGMADGTISYIQSGLYGSAHKDEQAATSREFDYFIKSGALDFGTLEHDKVLRAITFRLSPLSGSEGVREIDMSFFGDYLDTGVANTTQLSFGFVLGVSKLGDLLSGVNNLERRQPVALRARHLAWQISGSGAINSMPIQAIGLSYRAHSQRSTLVWNRDI